MLKLKDLIYLFAEVVEWYTRATQNRMPHGLRVQVPSSAPDNNIMTFVLRNNKKSDYYWKIRILVYN